MSCVSMASQQRVQRVVIRLLRGDRVLLDAVVTGFDRQEERSYQVSRRHFAAFTSLRKAYVGAGMCILDPMSMYVSTDERRILTWLASRQRCIWPLYGEAIPFGPLLDRCASILVETGLKLPLSTAARTGMADQQYVKAISNSVPRG